MIDSDLYDNALDLLNQINSQIDFVMADAKKRGIPPMSMINPDGTFVMSVLLHAKAMTLNTLTHIKEK